MDREREDRPDPGFGRPPRESYGGGGGRPGVGFGTQDRSRFGGSGGGDRGPRRWENRDGGGRPGGGFRPGGGDRGGFGGDRGPRVWREPQAGAEGGTGGGFRPGGDRPRWENRPGGGDRPRFGGGGAGGHERSGRDWRSFEAQFLAHQVEHKTNLTFVFQDDEEIVGRVLAFDQESLKVVGEDNRKYILMRKALKYYFKTDEPAIEGEQIPSYAGAEATGSHEDTGSGDDSASEFNPHLESHGAQEGHGDAAPEEAPEAEAPKPKKRGRKPKAAKAEESSEAGS